MASNFGPAHAWLWNLLDDEPTDPADDSTSPPRPAVGFLTFRTPLALPASRLRELHRFRDEWLRRRGLTLEAFRTAADILESNSTDVPATRERLAARAFAREYARRWLAQLDAARGGCDLLDEDSQASTASALGRLDENGCRLTDYLVLPNRVHVMARFPDEPTLERQCKAWLEDSTTRLDKRQRRRGSFWRRDECDHRVQSSAARRRLRRYLAETPRRLRLPPSAFKAEMDGDDEWDDSA